MARKDKQQAAENLRRARREGGSDPGAGHWILNYVNPEDSDPTPTPSPAPFRAKQTKYSEWFQLNADDGFLSATGSGYIEVHPQINGAVVFTNGVAEPEDSDAISGWAVIPMSTGVSTEQSMVSGHMYKKCMGKASSDAAWGDVPSYPISSLLGGNTSISCDVRMPVNFSGVGMRVRFYASGVWSAWSAIGNAYPAEPNVASTIVVPAATTRVAFGALFLAGPPHDQNLGVAWTFNPIPATTAGCGNDLLLMQAHDVDTLTDVPDMVGWRCTGCAVRVYQTGTLTSMGGNVVGAQVPAGYTMDGDPITSLSKYPVDRHKGRFNDPTGPGLHLWWRPQSYDDFELNTVGDPHRPSSFLAVAFDVVDTTTTINVQVDMIFDYQSFNQLHVGLLTPPAHELLAYLYILGLVPVASCNPTHRDKGTLARLLAKAKRLLGSGVDYALENPQQVAAGLAALAAL